MALKYHQGRCSANRAVVLAIALLVSLSLYLETTHSATFTVGDSSGWDFSVGGWINGKQFKAGDMLTMTLMVPVTLIKCLQSIKEYAFVKSPYPVRVTLESHLTADLQAKVAETVIETFRELLYYLVLGCLEEFPSPEALKHRIILSTKPPKEYLDSEGPTEKDSTTKATSGKESPHLAAELDPDDRDDEGSDGCEQKSCQLGARQYKHLIAIHVGKPKNGLKEALRAGIGKIKRLSLSETTLEKAAESYGIDLVRFTQKNILRVYPKGTRVSIPKANFISWLAIQNRLNIGDKLKSFGISHVVTYPLCHQHSEDHSHLFFKCPFSESVSLSMKEKIDVNWLALNWFDLVPYIAMNVRGKSLRSIISRLVFTCSVYRIWLERNNRVFTKERVPEDIVVVNIVDMIKFRVLSLKNLKRNSKDKWFLSKWRLPTSILKEASSL
ncbi:phosphoinositide phospholipase C 2-like [Camellia sinensis]|uniref:phosphoinositide phospholipase C 2-like n=1 Tax=Camellia sinensis TaxID=4442 RepID=UPI0010357DE2|nr:phosphoinositide phospholipase C 2-like [Camellia sinensis]